MTEKKAFNLRLVGLRVSKGLTQSDAGALCEGMSGTQISHYESGRREPTLTNLRQIAIGLEVSADWLLGLE